MTKGQIGPWLGVTSCLFVLLLLAEWIRLLSCLFHIWHWAGIYNFKTQQDPSWTSQNRTFTMDQFFLHVWTHMEKHTSTCWPLLQQDPNPSSFTGSSWGWTACGSVSAVFFHLSVECRESSGCSGGCLFSDAANRTVSADRVSADGLMQVQTTRTPLVLLKHKHTSSCSEGHDWVMFYWEEFHLQVRFQEPGLNQSFCGVLRDEGAQIENWLF